MQHGKARFCVDLQEVNSKTVTDQYPLPRQDTIFSSFSVAIVFSSLDMNKRYHQIGVTEKSCRFTAFTTEYGLWEFLCVPFGVKNAPAHFQRIMDTILAKYRWDFILCYIDDIIIFSTTFDDHLIHIGLVLAVLTEVGLTVDEKKCHFGYEDLDLLGHHISRLGLSTKESKVQAIIALPFPETVT
jgi:hypothetical protein